MVPTFGRQEQADVKFKASLVFRARSIQENPAKKNNNQKTNQKKNNTKTVFFRPSFFNLSQISTQIFPFWRQSLYVTLAVLELTIQTRMALNSK